jgi:hypothetical protein
MARAGAALAALRLPSITALSKFAGHRPILRARAPRNRRSPIRMRIFAARARRP